MVLWACFSNKVSIYQKTNNQNGSCYDHGTGEIMLAGSQVPFIGAESNGKSHA